MDIYHDKIIEADCIILSSPIYCMGLAAQVKALVDRAQVFRSRKYVLKLPLSRRTERKAAWGIPFNSRTELELCL